MSNFCNTWVPATSLRWLRCADQFWNLFQKGGVYFLERYGVMYPIHKVAQGCILVQPSALVPRGLKYVLGSKTPAGPDTVRVFPFGPASWFALDVSQVQGGYVSLVPYRGSGVAAIYSLHGGYNPYTGWESLWDPHTGYYYLAETLTAEGKGGNGLPVWQDVERAVREQGYGGSAWVSLGTILGIPEGDPPPIF